MLNKQLVSSQNSYIILNLKYEFILLFNFVAKLRIRISKLLSTQSKNRSDLTSLY